MNYSDTLPRVYDVEDGYNFRLHAVPFVTLEDVQKISQEMEKFSGKLKTKVQHVVNILEQFPTRLVNIHAHNYSVPSEYVEHYCVVQAQPEGREALAHKKTDLLFLTDPLKWRLDCLKQLWEERTTVEKINDRCKTKINMACVQYAMDLCEKIENGTICVEVVDMQKMAAATSYAIFDITNGGYVNSHLKHACETLNSAEFFPSEIAARNYIKNHADYGRHYTIVPIQMQADPHLDIVSRGVYNGTMDERDQEQLSMFERETISLNISANKSVEHTKKVQKM